MKIGSNSDINKDHQKVTPPEFVKVESVAHTAPKMHLMKSMDKPVKDNRAFQHEQTDNPKMLAEKHNDDKLVIKLLIVGAGFGCLSFLVENKWHHYFSQSVVPW